MSLNVGELVATLTVDDTRFTRGIQDSQRSMSAFEQVVRQSTNRVETSFRDSTRQVSNLGTTARNTAGDVGRVGGSANDVGRVGDNARRAEREVQNLGDAARRTAQQTRDIGGAMDDAADSAGEAGGDAGGSFFEGFSSKMGKLGGPIAAGLAGVAGIGLAAGAVLMKALQDGMDREAQLDTVQAKLGVNEDTARKIGAAAGQSYSSGWGESVEANMDAARAAIQSGLLNGEEDTGTMKATIDQLNIVSGIMGEEIPALTRSAAQAVKTGFAEDAPAALDMFVKAQQAGLNTSEDFLDTIDEYGIQFKKLGLDGPEAMGLLSQAVKNGARDTDTAADALKEFSIRAVDGSKASAEAYELLGMSAEDMTDKISQGGQSAQDGLADVLVKLREMEPGVERTTAAVGLFGTKAEDMGDALYTMDLSTAVRELGAVEGAAAKAGDTMSSNTAASFDSAKRSMETSMDDIKLALAEGFGPALTDMANWVTTHKPEIIGFFTDLAGAGFATLDGILSFTSGSLRAFGALTDGISDWSGSGMNALGVFAEGLGDVMSLIPGMGSTGDALSAVGSGLQTMSDQLDGAGDKARAAADVIDNTIRPAVQGVGEDVVAAGNKAENSTRLMQALGTAVVQDIPDEKSIIIDSNTPEQKAALEQLGLTVQALPDGTFVVTANTTEGQSIIDNFVLGNDGKTITMNVQTRALNPIPGVTIPQPGTQNGRSYDGTIVGGLARADGAFEPKNTQAHIQNTQITTYGEPETEGESYIPHAPSKRARSEAILSETAKRFGLGLVRSFADGGVITKTGHDESLEWARSMDPVGYGMGGFSTNSIDCSGAVAGAINKALGLDAYDSRMSTVTEGSWLQAKGAILGKGPEGTIRVGWWDEGGGANGHTAMTYADGTNFESNGSEGVVVGGQTGWDDPSFTDHAWFPNSGDLGLASDTGAGSAPPEGGAGGTGESGGSTDMAYATTESGALLSTDGQRVYVTNWPSSMGDSQATPAEERKPILTAGLKLFANGGIEDHTAQIAGAGDMRVWAEPETGGEAYVPLAPGKRGRSVEITRQVANRFGYQLVPMADGGLTGFGGWQNDDRPTLDMPLDGKGVSPNKARANAYALTALGIGGLNTLLSGFDGKGNFTGKFDTGSNSPALLEEGVSMITGKLDELIEAAKNPDPVSVDVNIDQGNRSAEIAIMKAGL